MLITTKATAENIEELCVLLDHLFSAETEFTPNRDLQRQGLSYILLDETKGTILVARRDNNIVGMVNLLYTISTALGSRVAILEDMVVVPEERNQKVGSLLIKKAIQTAMENGCKRITLLTDDNNLDGHRFYQRHGFKKSSMCAFRKML